MMGWVRRRGWLIVATTLIAALAAQALSSGRDPEVAAEVILLVPSGATREDPGAAGEATRLAVTLANALQEDDIVLETAADEVGLPVEEIRDGLTVTSVPDTSLIEVRFESTDEDAAVEVVETIAEAITGPSPATPVVPRGGLSMVSSSRVVDDGTPELPAIPMGAIPGFVLGLLLVGLWERADPRVDSVKQLRAVTSFPVTDARTVTRSSVEAHLQSWKELTPKKSRMVLFVGIDDKGAAERLSALFQQVDPTVRCFSATGSEVIRGNLGLRRPDLAVLVAASGAHVDTFGEVHRSLANFGVLYGWALFVSRRKRKHSFAEAPNPKADRPQEKDQPSPSSPVNAEAAGPGR